MGPLAGGEWARAAAAARGGRGLDARGRGARRWRSPRRAAGPGSTSSSTPAWGASAPGPRTSRALAEAAAAAGDARRRGRPDDPLRDRRRDARARTPAFMAEQLLRFRAAAGRPAPALPRGPGPRRQLGRHPARAARRPSTWSAAASRSTAARPSAATRRRRPAAGDVAGLVPGLGQDRPLARERRLRARLARGAGHAGRPGAGGVRRRLRARALAGRAEVLVGRPAGAGGRHDLDGPAHRGPRPRGRGGGRGGGGADRRPGRRADHGRGGRRPGGARSTTR